MQDSGAQGQEGHVRHADSFHALIDSARSAAGRPEPASDSTLMCLFCDGPGMVPAAAIADFADESAEVCVPLVTDMEVPGWVGPGTMAVLVLGGGASAASEGLAESLIGRGCRVERIVPEGGMSFPEFCGHALGTMAAMIDGIGLASGAVPALNDALDAAEGDATRFSEASSVVAGALHGRIPAFYSTSEVHSIAVAWRHAMSEALDRPCFCGELPEFDHNELVGWSDPNEHAPELQMVVIEGHGAEGLVPDIVRCMVDVLHENGRDVLRVDIGGGCVMRRVVFGMALAFMASDGMARCSD